MNGDSNGAKSANRFTLAQVGAVASITAVLGAAGGYISGYLALKSEMRGLNLSVAQVQGQVSGLSSGASNDRQALSNRLTTLETEMKWIKEAVGELRIYLIPKR